MILEAIVSSVNAAGQVNFAPVGVHVLSVAPAERASLRLYSGSQTYANLLATGQGVICFCNDVALFVETALYSATPPSVPSQAVIVPRLAAADTVWEFTVDNFNTAAEPAIVAVRVVHRRQGAAGFDGFCRARAAVLEATIAATRWRLAPDKLTERWNDWREIVVKTGGASEWKAFNRVCAFLRAAGLVLPPARTGPVQVKRGRRNGQDEKDFAPA